ncbi:ras-related protein Rab-23-like [Mizuhopecten yessoensis]|uniref:Ras-related protein Rab-23 n=1 Tax=Mizuhopecten yessoensis TaxID=6573 RepID=A0A210Q9G5_MIZYE|nr:ras-related protein Rab-23-like [Mizuhopecten yessoensis]XP_021363911.1 ras-related protein Rab-23-like [Mizuhopecten yessoensis]XP_021363912.1 ras-related protein Rab-23-like [Mizuhopecten yessoensis]OWF45380.1 Ras-related protein Rab-23 [Mizuhopecten yessoensis]
MREEDMETAIKVVIVGNGAVGKSSMIQRYCKGIFTKEYKKTIGVDFLERQLEVNNEDVRLMLWDTAGQEEFDAITKAYYRGAQACVLAFSTVDRDSFDAVESWKKKVEDEVGEIGMVIIQNKIDLIDDTVVNDEEAEDLAKRLRLRFYRTSVKENLNVEEVFRYLSEKYLDQINCEVEEPETKIAIGQGLMDGGGITNNSKDKDSSKSKNKKIGNGKTSNKHRFKLRNGEDSTIKLEPSKRRTRGKKAIVTAKCVIL